MSSSVEPSGPGGADYERAYTAMAAALNDFTVAAQRAVVRSRQVMACLVLFTIAMFTVAVFGWLAVHRLYDCTIPGRGCYDQALKRQGDAIAQLNAHADASRLLAGECDKQTTTAAEFKACVLGGRP